MAAYLPNTVDSPLFRSRAQPGGAYDVVTSVLEDPKYLCLADAEYERDFKHRRRPLDNWSGSYGFTDAKGKDLVLFAVGEILGSDYGTMLGALGNHFVGSSASPFLLTDSSKPKHVIALGRPSFCSKKLRDIWFNQIVTLETMVMMDKEADEANGKSYTVKESCKSLAEGGDQDIMYVVSPPIYKMPKNVNTNTTRARKKKRPLDDDAGEEGKPSEHVVTVDSDNSGPLPTEMLPKHAVKLDAAYDRRVFRDYGGKLFAQRHVQAVQQDFRDIKCALIPPWEYPEKLRPGGLLLAAIAPVVWVTKDRNGGVRKTYHNIVQGLRLMATSDAAPQLPLHVKDDDSAEEYVENELALALRAVNVCVPDEVPVPEPNACTGTESAGQGGDKTTLEQKAVEEDVNMDAAVPNTEGVEEQGDVPKGRSSRKVGRKAN
ncbi:hypothetical protein VNI00_010356 [Paramarasmius palmivorus]|uniref:Uncharacterized protein n=1 Tax=Paramarasmius palmivorus TaxID=297713 RepID=A0AAW0CJF5_9AGAR